MDKSKSKSTFQWICFYVALTKSECAAFHKMLPGVVHLNKSGNVRLDIIYMGSTKHGTNKQKPIWYVIEQGIITETKLPLEYWSHWNLFFETIPVGDLPIGFVTSGHHDGVLLSHKSFVSIDHQDLSSHLSILQTRLKSKLSCFVMDTCWGGVENVLLKYIGIVKYVIASPGYWDQVSILTEPAFHVAYPHKLKVWLAYLLYQFVQDPEHKPNLSTQSIFASLYDMKKLPKLHKQILETINQWKLSSASLFDAGDGEGYSGDSLQVIIEKNKLDPKPFNDFVVHYEEMVSDNKKVVPKPSKLVIFLKMVTYRKKTQVCKSIFYYQGRC